MGSQAPVMPDAWMHPLPCPIFGDPPRRGGSFWPMVLGVWQPWGGSPTPAVLCFDAGGGGGSPVPRRGRGCSCPLPLWASSYPTAPVGTGGERGVAGAKLPFIP